MGVGPTHVCLRVLSFFARMAPDRVKPLPTQDGPAFCDPHEQISKPALQIAFAAAAVANVMAPTATLPIDYTQLPVAYGGLPAQPLAPTSQNIRIHV